VPTNWFIERLPERFTDLLTGDAGAEVIALMGHVVVCCCLKCGAVITLQVGTHRRPGGEGECNGGVLLALVGQYATCGLIRNPEIEGQYHPGVPIYLSEYGDEGVGFCLGCPLFLSHQRRDEYLKQMITGSHLAAKLR
jgi:hypothetical protein